MAINFLDNIQLNQNQLLGARLENVTSDPGSALGGDIIFNSTSNILKYYNGTGWISLTEDTGVAGSGTANTVAMFTASDTIGDSIYTQNGGATEAKIVGGIFVTGSFKDSGGGTGTSGQLLSSTGTATDWVDAPVGYAKWVLTGDSGTQDIEDGNTVLVAGGTNITTAVTATDTVTLNLDASPTLAGELTVSGTGQSSFAGQVTIPTTPVATTDAASKSYVDSAVTGGLNVKGGFNAATGAITGGGNLTVGGSRVAIAVGDYYVVTVAGNFFANAATPLTPGDSVLVQTAAAAGASIEDDFAVIQSDTDLATLTTVGIGNVNPATLKPLQGIAVDYPVATPGTALVGLDIKNMDAFAGGSDVLSKSDQVAVYDASAGWNKRTTVLDIGAIGNSNNSFASTSASGTSHVFTHNLNSSDVIVQVYDVSTLETVYANVERNTVNQVTVTTAATANIRCLIQKIG